MKPEGRYHADPTMSAREPVHRTHLVARATPAQVYAVVTDFPAYARLFPEFKQTRVVSTTGNVVRVEFRAEVVIAVRYVLDLACDPSALTVDWTFVEIGRASCRERVL